MNPIVSPVAFLPDDREWIGSITWPSTTPGQAIERPVYLEPGVSPRFADSWGDIVVVSASGAMPRRGYSSLGAQRTYASGALPGGMTADQWSALTPAQQSAFIQQNAQTAEQRQTLYAGLINAGVSNVQTVVSAVIAAQQASATTQSQKDMIALQGQIDLEKARIQAQRDIAVAQLGQNPNAPPTTPTTVPQGTEQKPTADQSGQTPATTGMSTGTMVAIGAGVVVLGTLGYVLFAQKAAGGRPRRNPIDNPVYREENLTEMPVMDAEYAEYEE
jgi:hypothetical protein